MKKYESYLKKPFACVFFLALMLISVTAFGATIRVPADYSTIQAGIDAATAGDIVSVADGTYTGAGNKNLDFKGKAITVRCENGPENCVIDCEGDGRGFFFHSNETQSSVLDGFTIINGRTDFGGGILCSSSSPTIRNCRIIGNEAERAGGGIYCDFRCTITNCIIAGNTAVWGGGIGIVDAFGPVKVTNCTITGNTASFGSVMDISDSNATITNCILWGGMIRIALGPSRIPQFKYCDIEDDAVTGSTIIHSDPRFVDVSDPDPVNWDLHLKPSSPCIDTGTSNGAPNHDIDGDSRPQGAGYDMGADEYGGDNGPPPPVAHFSATPTSGRPPLIVDFTDQSTGQITSWSWDFGDGSTSTEQNPSHTYTDDGSYTVSLTVTGPGGSDIETKTGFISVVVVQNGPKPMPGISLLLLEDALAEPCPSAPTPISPSGTITDTTPLFTWSSVSSADVYWLQVKNASTNQDVLYRTNLTSTSYQKIVAMSPGNYKWRVASYRSGCSEAWSSYKNFIVGDTTLPVPGTWSTSTGFGLLEFMVNSSSTGITRVAYRFSNFQCGRIIYNGGISFSAPTPWPITNRKFTISNTLSPTTEMTIGGTFEQSGTRASGTWELVSEGTPCSGTWNAVR